MNDGSRRAYSYRENRAMVQFAVEQLRKRNPCAWEPKGNELWELAEKRKITDHSAQSMRDHFRRQVYKHIPKTPFLNDADRKLCMNCWRLGEDGKRTQSPPKNPKPAQFCDDENDESNESDIEYLLQNDNRNRNHSLNAKQRKKNDSQITNEIGEFSSSGSRTDEATTSNQIQKQQKTIASVRLASSHASEKICRNEGQNEATTSKKRLIPLSKSPAKLIQASNSPPRSAKKTREKSAEKRNLIRANSTAESNKVDEEIPKTPPRIRKEPMKKRKLASNQDLMLLESASESERGGPRARSRVLLNDPENRTRATLQQSTGKSSQKDSETPVRHSGAPPKSNRIIPSPIAENEEEEIQEEEEEGEENAEIQQLASRMFSKIAMRSSTAGSRRRSEEDEILTSDEESKSGGEYEGPNVILSSPQRRSPRISQKQQEVVLLRSDRYDLRHSPSKSLAKESLNLDGNSNASRTSGNEDPEEKRRNPSQLRTTVVCSTSKNDGNFGGKPDFVAMNRIIVAELYERMANGQLTADQFWDRIEAMTMIDEKWRICGISWNQQRAAAETN